MNSFNPVSQVNSDQTIYIPTNYVPTKTHPKKTVERSFDAPVGKTITLSQMTGEFAILTKVTDDKTILDIQNLVKDILVTNVRIIYQGNILKNETTVSEIADGATLHFVVKSKP